MENLFKAKINTKFVRFQLKRNVRFMVLAATLMIALYPLLVFTNFVLNDTAHDTGSFLVGRVALTVILTLSVFVVPFSLFSYLNSKRNLDVYHALPITRKDLYLSSLISSVLIILIPFTIVYIIGSIYYVAVIPDVDVILLVKQYVYSVVLAIATLMPIIFAMMNTGTLIDGLLYSGMLHVLPAIGYAAYLLYGEAILLGFKAGSDLLFLLFSSPIFALFDLNFNVDRIYPNVWLVVVYWLVFSFVATWIVLQVYKHRKSEKAETPFTNKWFFPIVSTLFMIVIQVFFFSTFATLTGSRILDFRTLIFPVVFTFVGYMVLDVIANRGFRHFFKAAMNFVVITLITLSGFYGSVATKGLGYVTHVPQLSSVEKVSFSFSGGNPILQTISQNSYDYLSDYRTRKDSITFKDPNQIQTIMDVHQTILDGYKKINYNKNIYALEDSEKPANFPNIYSGSFNVTYSLKNGSKVSRQYNVAAEWLDGLMKFINTEEFFDFRYPVLNQSSIKNNKVQEFSFSDPLLTKKQGISFLNAERFATVYREDYLNKSVDDFLNTKPIVGFINLNVCNKNSNCSNNTYPIREDDTKTIEFLTSEGNIISLTSPVSNEHRFLILLKDSSDFFLSPSIPFDYYKEESKVKVVSLSFDETVKLLPYLNYQSLTKQPVDVLRVIPSIEGMNEYAPTLYGINAAGKSVFEELLLGKPVETKDFYTLMYGGDEYNGK